MSIETPNSSEHETRKGPERFGLPAKQGLYDPRFEHDACGVGFVVNIKGRKSHEIVRQALTILINLEHPLVMAALGDGHVEDTTFRRLSYEIAFSEYAMGLGYELSQQDPNMPPDDLLYEVRSTLNRISTAAVALYR